MNREKISPAVIIGISCITIVFVIGFCLFLVRQEAEKGGSSLPGGIRRFDRNAGAPPIPQNGKPIPGGGIGPVGPPNPDSNTRR